MWRIILAIIFLSMLWMTPAYSQQRTPEEIALARIKEAARIESTSLDLSNFSESRIGAEDESEYS